MAGHHPWAILEERLEKRLAARGTYWSDLRFRLRAETLEEASRKTNELIAEAETRGFELELGHVTSEPPVDA